MGCNGAHGPLGTLRVCSLIVSFPLPCITYPSLPPPPQEGTLAAWSAAPSGILTDCVLFPAVAARSPCRYCCGHLLSVPRRSSGGPFPFLLVSVNFFDLFCPEDNRLRPGLRFSLLCFVPPNCFGLLLEASSPQHVGSPTSFLAGVATAETCTFTAAAGSFCAVLLEKIFPYLD